MEIKGGLSPPPTAGIRVIGALRGFGVPRGTRARRPRCA